jgi:hypothetical protein
VIYALGQLPVSVTSVALLGQAPITALLAVVGGELVSLAIYVVNSTPHRPETDEQPLIK